MRGKVEYRKLRKGQGKEVEGEGKRKLGKGNEGKGKVENRWKVGRQRSEGKGNIGKGRAGALYLYITKLLYLKSESFSQIIFLNSYNAAKNVSKIFRTPRTTSEQIS